jgi:small subunit ribosomal protein S17
MAEETPDNIAEEVENAAETGETVPEAAADETTEAVAPEGGDPAPAPAAPARETRRDRLEARRAARRPAQRGQVSPEQRDEERRARRAATAKQRRAYRAKLKQRRAAGRADRPAPEPDRAPDHGPGTPKVRQGVVTSAKGDKTITVRIDVVRRHRRYHKIMRSTLKLYAHDEANNANEGDTVRVVECRPMSRTKRWRLTEVLERAR